MGRAKWWYGPEKRSCAKPLKQEEKPVCRRSEDCNGCPFPASGFICWSDNGECMRTRIEKLKENDKHDSTEDQTPGSFSKKELEIVDLFVRVNVDKESGFRVEFIRNK